jgi:tetratricopeptide (TPR) repeat protein
MDAPKECATIPVIEAGGRVEVPLYGLFNDRILDVTEATKAVAEVSLYVGADLSANRSATVLVYDRNALTWSDDRKAAAFVSAKDPWVMDLTGNILASVKGERNPGLSKNLQTGMAIHEGLRAYGMAYVLSPNRPFAKDVVDPEIVDTLKFPRQTLNFRSGDCADLSVLYASCLESAGIETAFVTVPGHIFIAFDLGLEKDEIEARRLVPGSFIEVGGKAWVPLETTLRESDFVEAWARGAEEWRASEAKGVAAFYPIREAWKDYGPVGLPANGTSVVPPPADSVRKSFAAVLSKAVDAELAPGLASLGSIDPKSQADVKKMNGRGILHARYGRLDEAEKDFRSAAALNFLPALLNLGTLSMLKSDYLRAIDSFNKAISLEPRNAKAFFGLSKALAAIGKDAESKAALEMARDIDPTAAKGEGAAAKAPATGSRETEAEATIEWL